MDEIKTTVREFLRNYRKLTAKHKTIIVSNQGEPEGVYIPYDEWQTQQERKSRRFKLKDIEGITFKTDDPYLSQKIDEIVYGPFDDKKTKRKKK